VTPRAPHSLPTARPTPAAAPPLPPELLRIIKALAEGAARRDYAAATQRAALPKD
jgi:hypothetical protein